MFLRRLLLVSAFVCLSFPNYMFASFIQASPINGFSPSTICSGSNTAVIVTGYGFTNVIAVKIGMNNVSYNIINDSTLEISNTSGASTDYIFLETSTATMKSPNQLSIIELTPIINGNLSGVVCGGTDITYTAAGGSFYEFFVDGISFGVPSPNNSITFKPAHGQNIYVKAYDASMNCAAFSNVITAQIETVSIPQLISSATNVTVCNNEPLSTSIIYSLTNGANDAFVTGLPPGISAEISGSNIIISGTPNVASAQDYNYVITPSGMPCVSSAYGTISIALDTSLEKTPSSGGVSQILCEGNSLDPIEYIVGGGGDNAVVSGLPNGVTSNYDTTAGVLSIQGTPSDNISIENTYNYAVTTSGSGCNEKILRGSITVQPLAELSLLAGSGALDQVLCEGVAVVPVLIALEGGTDIVSISGLPNGVNYTIDGATKVVTISGTPLENIAIFEVFSFVVSSISERCTETTLQGAIRVNGDSNLEHLISSGDTSQTLCEGMALTPISFTVDGGATNAIVSGLPSGMIFDFDAAAGILSIEGTPTDNITLENTYNYTISTTGGGCNQQIFRGTISIQPKAELKLLASSGTLNQVLCEGEAITPILIALEGGTDFSSITGLPSGVNYSFDNVTKILSVSGTPAADISSIEQALISFATTTSCNTSFLTGVLTINQQSSVELISHLQTQNQLVCGVTPIEKIEYQLRDGASNASVSGLPAGVTWSLSTNIIEIVGVPENVVYETAYDYTIIADGNGCASSITSSIVVTPNTMDMPIAEEQQYFCVYNTPTLTDIVVYANNLKWFSADGLVELDPGTLLVDGETYYAHNEVIISEASAIDRYACRSFATPIEVFISDTPAPQILELTNNFCSDGFYTLSDIKTNVDQVIWYNSLISDTPLSQETPLETNSYYAAAINPKTGCESTTRTNFEVVVNPCTVVVYNALSINGDGLNEKLIIENIEYFTENELMIYNRNGRIVFKTTNYGANNNFFRGYSNMNSTLGKNKVLPMGTYFYTFSFVRPSDRKLMTEKGFINLVAN
jgi:hypothetical protein